MKTDSCRGTEDGFLSRNNSRALRKGTEQFTGIRCRGEVELNDPEGDGLRKEVEQVNHKTA